MKKNVSLLSLFILLISLVLSGCDIFQQNLTTPTVDVAATETQVAERTIAAVTVEAALTEAALATPTDLPSLTPSERPTATITNTPTETPVILDTPTRTVTTTPEPTQTIILPTMTTAPVDFRCSLVWTEPVYKAVLDRGEDFDVHWTIENTGTETWYYEFVTGRFRNGVALHRYSSSFTLTDAVEPRETYEITLDMQAPFEPGEYSAVWILEHRKEAFCWFSVDIVVK